MVVLEKYNVTNNNFDVQNIFNIKKFVSLELHRKFRYPDRVMGTYGTRLPVISISLPVMERGFKWITVWKP